jgi:hypothetical protein
MICSNSTPPSPLGVTGMTFVRTVLRGGVCLLIFFTTTSYSRGAVLKMKQFRTSTYHLLDTDGSKWWSESEAEGVTLGGHLVTIETAAESQWLANTFGPLAAADAEAKSLPDREFISLWIGLSDAAEEGVYRWSSGSIAAYRNWAPLQPENGPDDEDYIGLVAHFPTVPALPPGSWHDIIADTRVADLPYGLVETRQDVTSVVKIDERGTFTRPTSQLDINGDIPDATKVNLSDGLRCDVHPGDWIRIQTLGDFRFTQHPNPPDPGPYGNATLRSAFGIFSGTSQLLPKTQSDRVPAAIDVAEGRFQEVLSDNDPIPEDFWISPMSDGTGGALVRVPAGATHLFIGAADTQWFDNDDLNDDFQVQVTLLYPGRMVGDWDFSGEVDGNDLLVWQRNNGRSGIDLLGDGNLDGRVDVADLQIWKQYFGQTVADIVAPLATTGAIPEPTAWIIATPAVLIVRTRRKGDVSLRALRRR